MSKNKNPKATRNKARDVEIKPTKPVFYELPEALRQAVLKYIENSIPRNMTVREAVELSMALQKLKKIRV